MISIITPVLNGSRFIAKNILSIMELTIPFEHIIVDGGSKDDTLQIICKYPHIKLLEQKEENGMYGGIDLGFNNAKGIYICWINCDDYVFPEGFEKLYHFALNNHLDFASSDAMIENLLVNRKQRVRSTKYVKFFLSKGFFPFIQPSVIYKKSLYQKVNGLNYNDFKVCGDIDLFYRMSKIDEARFGYIPIVSSAFIIHGNSLGDLQSEKGQIEIKNSGIPKKKFVLRIILKALRILNI
jgi:glycosyltransferase involved in cell wall biosynthesis